jgi:hypothetical protein
MGSTLSKSQVDAICKQVYRRFPELRGTRPRVSAEGRNGRERYVLSFKGTVRASDGASLRVSVRAVADANGRVIKMTSSR